MSRVGAITLFVEDPARSRSFYERAFEHDAVYEDESSAVFELGDTLLNLLAASAAGELIEPAAVAAPDVGARFMLTIWVDDADAACARLEANGVRVLNGPVDRPWGKRTAAFTDPDGNVWELAQDIS